MYDDNYILKHIEDLCKFRNWSRYTLSTKSGLSQSTISNLFKRTNQPTFSTLCKICDAFDITLAQFFEPNNLIDLTLEQDEILKKYNMLTANDKNIIKMLLKSLSDKNT